MARNIVSEMKAFNMPRYAGQFTLHEVYLKSEADKVFAQKDKEIAELKEALQESENARYEAGADAADYYQENSRLKRALWLARANRALDKIAWFKLWNSSISTMNPEDGARQEFDKWKKNLGKFLKKAKQ